MSDQNEHWIPKPTEHTRCAVCEGEDSVEVSSVGRNGIAVRNVACKECGLVYVNPRPTADAMAEFYRSKYRYQHLLPMRMRDGRMAQAGTPEFEDALMYRAEILATNALGGGMVQAGDRVLDVGCRRGDVLAVMNQSVPIEMHGIEPDVQSSIDAEAQGVTMHNGVMETYEPGEVRFDQIQIFHVLEHIHHPLDALTRLRGWLKPRGRLVIDVPDTDQPYGGLGFFFQYPHLYSFSAQSLGALLKRAGFQVVAVGKGATLFVVAVPAPLVEAVPVPYSRAQLGDNPLDGEQVASRLQLYDALETGKNLVQSGADVPVDVLCRIVGLPALQPPVETEQTHLFRSTVMIAGTWLKAGRRDDALRLLKAGRDGPRCAAVRRGFERVLREMLMSASSPRPQV